MKGTHFIFTIITLISLSFPSLAQTEDSNINQVKMTKLVFGPTEEIIITGEWFIEGKKEDSRQQFLKNKKSGISLVIALNTIDKFSFAKNKNLSNSQFVKEFVKWDADYLAENGVKTKIIEDESMEKGYILWQASTDKGESTFLYGCKNGKAYNFSSSSKIIEDIPRNQFLVELFLAN